MVFWAALTQLGTLSQVMFGMTSLLLKSEVKNQDGMSSPAHKKRTSTGLVPRVRRCGVVSILIVNTSKLSAVLLKVSTTTAFTRLEPTTVGATSQKKASAHLTSARGLARLLTSDSDSAQDSRAQFRKITKADGPDETDTPLTTSPSGSRTLRSLRTHKFSNPRSISTTSGQDKNTRPRSAQTCSTIQHTESLQVCPETPGMSSHKTMNSSATSRHSTSTTQPLKASITSILAVFTQKVCLTSMSPQTTSETPKWTLM